MEVDCPKDWDAMTPVSCGRFCEGCNKVVLDLRGKSYEEIKALRAKEKICGIFLPEQVAEETISLEKGGKVRVWLAACIAFLGLEIGAAHAQAPAPDTVQVIQVKKQAAPPGIVIAENTEQAPVDTMKPATKKKSKYYISKRFPFVHKRKKAFWIGCPSF